jgi:CBS domain-containing protein
MKGIEFMSHISDVMSTEVSTVTLKTPITEVIDLVIKKSVDSVAVVDDEMRLLGMVSKNDLLKLSYKLMLDHLPISEYLQLDQK